MIFTDHDEIDTGSRPRLPGDLPWFCWTFSRWDLAIDAEGYLVAVPCVLVGMPGVNGVGEDRHTGQLNIGNALSRHRAANRSRLDDSTPIEAFDNAAPCYRVEHKPTKGKPQYHDAWQKWRVEAGEWVKEVDADGYAHFLRWAAAEMEPTKAQIGRAVRRARNEGREAPDNPLILGSEPKPTPKPRRKSRAKPKAEPKPKPPTKPKEG